MTMIWVLLAVVIVLFVVLIVLLSVIYSELQRIASWSESVEFPEIKGFAPDELKRILLRGPNQQNPDRGIETVDQFCPKVGGSGCAWAMYTPPRVCICDSTNFILF